jgi:hypothetical protein
VALRVEPDIAVLLGLLGGEPSAKIGMSRFQFPGFVGGGKLLAHAPQGFVRILKKPLYVGPHQIL